jgi:hypothetical protein
VKAIVVVAAIVAVALAAPRGTSAQIPFPTLFKGTVTIGGSAAPTGTTISVWLSSGACAPATFTTTTAGSFEFIASCPGGTPSTATLRVNGADAATVEIVGGGSYDDLTLAVAGGSTTAPVGRLVLPYVANDR